MILECPRPTKVNPRPCDYSKCPRGKIDWFNYGEIRFCRYQVMWIIKYLGWLSEGFWVEQPGDDIKVRAKKQRLDRAGFENACHIAAEIEVRLKTGGDVADWLITEIQTHYLGDDATWGLKNILGVPRDLLFYCEGKRRKRDSFPQWRADKKRRSKNQKYMVKGRAT